MANRNYDAALDISFDQYERQEEAKKIKYTKKFTRAKLRKTARYTDKKPRKNLRNKNKTERYVEETKQRQTPINTRTKNKVRCYILLLFYLL
jgi:hypothetical protein